MAGIRTSIELCDVFSAPMANVVQSVNSGVSAMEQMQSVMNASVNTAAFAGVSEQANQAASAVGNLSASVADLQNASCDVTVTPVVTQQPQIDVPENVTVNVNAETEAAGQRIAEIQQRLQSIIPMQEAINTVARNSYILPEDSEKEIRSVNREIERLQAALDYLRDNPFNLDASYAEMQIDSISNGIDETISRQQELNSLLGNIPSEIVNLNVNPVLPDPLVENPETIPAEVQPNPPNEPVQIPVHWQTDNLEVFTNTGVERFEQEVQSANNMLNTLNQTQSRIAHTAAQTNLFPANAVSDMQNMQSRLQAIAQRIQQIENNPLNIGTDSANAELEQIRGQLHQIEQEQQNVNSAVNNMDVSAANDAYLRLSQTVGNTERYIRDNVDEQGQFNRVIEQGTNEANKLMDTIKGAVTAYVSIAGVKKALSFVKDCTELFNTQINAENQLMVVLGNMLDQEYVSQFEIETTADTTAAIDEINAISDNINEVVVPVSIEGRALQAEFDTITQKASEIQGRGIYGDEAMIAGAAEFATYLSDVEAVTMMMDTLADYAMGMSGGGALDSSAIVNYATGLGKIMTGSYEAMTKKGFEFTDVQKAIIEGTATQEQIISALGEEYVDMSQDMQSAAAISQVIEESWGGIYEAMSNTPEGKIIQLTNTWGDMKEVIGEQLYPYVLLFVDAINNNWGTIEWIVEKITLGLKGLLGVLSWVVEGAIAFAQAVMNNWYWIEPVIGGITAALLGYIAVLTIYNTIQAISNGIKAAAAFAEQVHAASLMMEQGATFAATAAQYGFNAALLACPITWIIIAIIAVIVALYAVVAAINEVTGTTISATGIIMGTLATIGAFLLNVIFLCWNIVAAFIEFFVNAGKHTEYAAKAVLVNIISAFLDFTAAIISGTGNLIGAVVGMVYKLKAYIDNRLTDIFNATRKISADIQNTWNNCVYNVQTFFYNLANKALDMAESIAGGAQSAAQTLSDVFVSGVNTAIGAINSLIDLINQIPGVEIGTVSKVDYGTVDFTSNISSLRGNLKAPEKPQEVIPYYNSYSVDPNDAYDEGMQLGQDYAANFQNDVDFIKGNMKDWLGEKPDDYWEAPKLDYINLSNAAAAGYDFGSGLENKISSLDFWNTSDIFSPEDYANAFSGTNNSGLGDSDLGGTGGAGDSGGSGLGNDVRDIADNTADMSDSMDISEEELKYLRDIAERDAVNRFTTAELKVEFHNENNINSDLDIDGIVEEIGARTMEELAAVAEGVYS